MTSERYRVRSCATTKERRRHESTDDSFMTLFERSFWGIASKRVVHSDSTSSNAFLPNDFRNSSRVFASLIATSSSRRSEPRSKTYLDQKLTKSCVVFSFMLDMQRPKNLEDPFGSEDMTETSRPFANDHVRFHSNIFRNENDGSG